jgi:ribose transport system substrate-binding protein
MLKNKKGKAKSFCLKTTVYIMVAALCLGALLSCSSTEGTLILDSNNGAEPTEEAEEGYRIMFVTPLVNHPIWLDAKSGAEDAGKELGANVTWQGPDIVDYDYMIDTVYEAISEEYDAIIVYPVEPALFEDAMRKALAAGIPLVTVCGDSDPSLRDSYVGTDVVRFGEEAAELIGQKSGGRANLAVLCTNFEAINQVQEYEAFLSVLKEKYPGVNVVVRESDETDTLKAVDKTYEILEKYPEVDFLWSMEGAGASGVAQVVKEKGLEGQITILGTDAMSPLLEAIKAGGVWGSLAQNFYNMGRLAVENAVGHIQGNEVQDTTDSGFVLITQENIHSYLESDGDRY